MPARVGESRSSNTSGPHYWLDCSTREYQRLRNCRRLAAARAKDVTDPRVKLIQLAQTLCHTGAFLPSRSSSPTGFPEGSPMNDSDMP